MEHNCPAMQYSGIEEIYKTGDSWCLTPLLEYEGGCGYCEVRAIAEVVITYCPCCGKDLEAPGE